MSQIDYTALINGEVVVEETPATMSLSGTERKAWLRDNDYAWYEGISDLDVSVIDKKKTITLHENQVNLTSESFSQFIPFEVDRRQDGYDLIRAAIGINYTVPGHDDIRYAPAVNVQYTDTGIDDKILFYWLVSSDVTAEEGTVWFNIQATGGITSNRGEENSYVWKSQMSKMEVIKTLGEGLEIELPENYWQDVLLKNVTEKVTAVVTKEALGENYYNKEQVDSLLDGLEKPELTPYVKKDDVDLTLDTDTYILTLSYGGASPKTINLPLETMVVGGRYDKDSKQIILTLKDGTEIEFSIADIISTDLATDEEVTAAITTALTDYYTKTEIDTTIAGINAKFGNLNEKTVETYVTDAVASIDISDRLGDLGKTEDGETDKTVEQFVNDKLGNLDGKTVEAYVTKAIEDVDVTEQLDELTTEFDKKLDIGESESVAKYVETYVDSKIGDIDLEEQLKNYVTEVQLREEIGELVGEDGSKLSVQEYIEEQLGDNVSSNYYKATYGKTEIEGVEQDNIFTLWKAAEDFDPAQPGGVEVTAVSQFQITGGGGSGATLNKLYLYREADKNGDPIKKYTYRVEDVERNKAILKYSFNGIQAANDQPVDDVTGVWEYRRGTTGDWKTISTFSLEITPEGTLAEFDASQYLKENDTYQFKLKASDDSGASTSLTWTVVRIYFAITLDFDDNKGYPIKDTYINYTPWGVGIEKTIHFKFSNLEEKTIKTMYSGTSASWLIPISEIYEPLQHGSHLLEVWMTAEVNGVEISSEHQYKDVIFYNPNRTVPIIGIAPRSYEVEQYSSENIEFTVYDPNTTKPKIYIQEEFNGIKGELQERTLEEPTDYYTFKAELPGEHKITFTVYDPTKEFNNTHTVVVNVKKFPYEISPIVGAVIDFNPVGKNNSEIVLNADGTATAWTNDVYTLSTSANFDWTNGGYQSDYDKNGKPISGTEHFLIKAGTKAELSYKFFGGDGDGVDPTEAGRDFKLIFKTQRVEKSNAQFLSCLSEATGQKIGLEMNVHEAYIHGGTNSLHLPYSEEDIIEFGFKLPKKIKDKTGAITGYEDGVSTSVMLDKGLSFVQKAGERQNITLGSDDCDLLVYRLKIYENELTDSQILTNFIADARTGEEMKNRYERNQIYDAAGKLTPKTLAEKCPWLRVITITAPTFTTGKGTADAVLGSTIEYRYGNGEKEGTYSYWRCEDAVHVGQGTSSNLYGASGRNIDLVLKEYKDKGNNPVIYLSEPDADPVIEESGKVSLSRKSIPNNYFNVKVNVASSENANNALLQKRFNDYEIFKRPFTDEQCITVDGKRVTPKDTMEFFNCVIFITETADSGHQEFEDKECHFYAIGNIGDSKKTDKTRLTDKRDDYECCLEIMDVRLPLSDFPKDTIVEAMQYELDSSGNEKYLFATQENLDAGKLLIKNSNTGGYDVATGTIDVKNVKYYIDGKSVEDFSEDFTYGWRYIKEYDPEDFKTEENTDEEAKAAADEKNKEIADYCAARWWELYDFITNSTDTEFHDNFENYFVLDSALYYYLFTTRYTMVDNRAKNSFWHYGKVGVDQEGNPIRKWDLNWGYDMDTALGTDNDGDMVYRYGYEDTDKDGKGVEIFRESDSTFFCRVRDLFATELATRYADNHAAWNGQDLIDQFDNWQAEFPEELWRLDIQRKYIRPATGPIDNSVDKGIDEKYLDNMANGRKKYQRRQFEKNQELYMASKYRAPAATGDNQIVLRCANVENDNSTLVVPQSFNITLTPFTYMYLNVRQASGMKKVRVTELFNEDGSSKTYPFEFTSGTDFVEIDSAKWIQSLGDISAMYPSSVSAPTAKKLKELIIGSDKKKVFDDASELSYYNKHLTTLSTGANELLEVLNIRNVGYNQVLDLSGLENLKEVYAKGSAITGVICADGGELQIAEMPAITSITMSNLVELNTLALDSYDKLTTLNINNCPKIDWIKIIDSATNLYNVRLIGINWQLPNDLLLARVYNMSDYNGLGKAQLAGYVKLGSVKERDLANYKARWKDLVIDVEDYNIIPEHLVQFVNEDGTLIADTYVADGETAVPPEIKPIKESTAEFDYEFAYWEKEGTNEEFSFETIITGPTVLIARYTSTIRTYTITYVNANGDILETFVNKTYGSYVDYSGEAPTRAPEGNKYFIFKGWDKSGYVTEEKEIKPVFEEFAYSDGVFGENGLKLKDLNATETYALMSKEKEKLVTNYSDYGEDDYINLQMGETFDTYTDLNPLNYENAIRTYGGSTTITHNSLFEEDQDFVFAIDYSLTEGVLFSNYSNEFGVKLYMEGTTQKLKFANSIIELKTDSGANREMLVLSHKKGTSIVKYFFSNKKTKAIKFGELKADQFVELQSGKAPLIFGGEYINATATPSGKGTIYWARKFNGYLSDIECTKLAAWTHETIPMLPCFIQTEAEIKALTYGYNVDGVDYTTVFTLLSKNVLNDPQPLSYTPWTEMEPQKYLDNRLFSGMNVTWRQLVKEVRVPTGDTAAATTTTNILKKVFLPAISQFTGAISGTYTIGLFEGAQIVPFAEETARVAYHENGNAVDFFTRSMANSSGRYYYVTEEGKVDRKYAYDNLSKYVRFMISLGGI